MEKEYVRCQVEEGIAVVTIDNQPALNALNGPTLTQLGQIFDALAKNQEVKGVIITGGGEKSFVAGADICILRRTPLFIGIRGPATRSFVRTGKRRWRAFCRSRFYVRAAVVRARVSDLSRKSAGFETAVHALPRFDRHGNRPGFGNTPIVFGIGYRTGQFSSLDGRGEKPDSI